MTWVGVGGKLVPPLTCVGPKLPTFIRGICIWGTFIVIGSPISCLAGRGPVRSFTPWFTETT